MTPPNPQGFTYVAPSVLESIKEGFSFQPKVRSPRRLNSSPRTPVRYRGTGGAWGGGLWDGGFRVGTKMVQGTVLGGVMGGAQPVPSWGYREAVGAVG